MDAVRGKAGLLDIIAMRPARADREQSPEATEAAAFTPTADAPPARSTRAATAPARQSRSQHRFQPFESAARRAADRLGQVQTTQAGTVPARSVQADPKPAAPRPDNVATLAGTYLARGQRLSGPQAAEYGFAALTLYQCANDLKGQALAHNVIAQAKVKDAPAALLHAVTARDLAVRIGDIVIEACALNGMAALQPPKQAFSSAGRALHLARAAGNGKVAEHAIRIMLRVADPQDNLSTVTDTLRRQPNLFPASFHVDFNTQLVNHHQQCVALHLSMLAHAQAQCLPQHQPEAPSFAQPQTVAPHWLEPPAAGLKNKGTKPPRAASLDAVDWQTFLTDAALANVL